MSRGQHSLNVVAICAASIWSAWAYAQPADNFYEGRQVTIVVASTAGGGYDTYARLVARHMPRHLPGEPRMIVSNMSGAGGNLAASYIVNSLPQDGGAMALVLPPTIMGGLYESVQKLRYDPSKLVLIGSANSEVDLCFLRADAGVASLQDAMSKTVIIGGSAEGSASRTQPVILNNVLGTKFRVVSGYPGTRQIVMAIESGEVGGVCGVSWSGMMLQKPDWLESGYLKPIVQNNLKGSPAVSAKGVAKAVDFARSTEDRQVLELIFAQQEFGRPFVAAPATPAARVALLRKAFMAAMKDQALLAEAASMKLDIDPVSGEELQALSARLYAMPAALVERAKDAQVYRPPQ